MASTKEVRVWNGQTIVTTDPDSGSPEDLETMEEALRAFLRAGWALESVWQHDGSRQYPGYLPSFDEFLVDFAELMGEPA